VPWFSRNSDFTAISFSSTVQQLTSNMMLRTGGQHGGRALLSAVRKQQPAAQSAGACRILSSYTERQNKKGRPVSPHVTVYRFPAVALSSIANRVTGVAMVGGEKNLCLTLQTRRSIAVSSSRQRCAIAGLTDNLHCILSMLLQGSMAWASCRWLAVMLQHLYLCWVSQQ
jgi:Succinate dehydrogenase/Fumarate reductase transmembrane subunit